MSESVRMQEVGQSCPRCGKFFTCGIAAGAERCWCASLPPLFAVPSMGAEQACYCPECLAELVEAKQIGEAGLA